jgi:hypothetical protein
MAIVNSITRITDGFGAPLVALSKNAALTGTATTSLAIAPTISSGYVRVKFSGADPATVGTFKVTMTNGSTTYVLLPTSGATAAGNGLDLLLPFNVDISISSVSVVATLTGIATTGTLDFEVCGNP